MFVHFIGARIIGSTMPKTDTNSLIVKGDLVAVPTLYPGKVGTAAHSDFSGRWVVWKETNGHWAAGSYSPDIIELIGSPLPAQIWLPI
jgi:hypothetical protein